MEPYFDILVDTTCLIKNAGNVRIGYRGVDGVKNQSSYDSGTEGIGLYVAWDRKLAEWFGDHVFVVKYYEPKNPFVIREPLYLLEESDEIYQPIQASDGPFLRACKQAVMNAGETISGWNQMSNAKIIFAFTDLVKKAGHDAVRVDHGASHQWDVIMDKSLIISIENPPGWQDDSPPLAKPIQPIQDQEIKNAPKESQTLRPGRPNWYRRAQ